MGIDQIRPFAGFDYIQNSNPTIDVNPNALGKTWLNISTGEIFVCIDVTTGLNKWLGQLSESMIAPVRPTSTVLESFTGSSTGLIGVAFDGTNLITSDTDTEYLYIHKGVSSTITSSFPAYGSNIKCLSTDKVGSILLADYTSGICVHYQQHHSGYSLYPDKDYMGLAVANEQIVAVGNSPVTWDFFDIAGGEQTSVTPPVVNARDFAFDGTDLWCSSPGVLTKMVGISTTVDRQITGFPPSLYGICFVGNRLYGVPLGENKIYAYKNEDEL